MVRKITPALVCLLFFLTSQAFQIPMDAQVTPETVIALKHANIYMPDGKWLNDGFIIIRGCKIAAVGPMKQWDSQTEVFHKEYDLKGRWVYPAFIDAFYTVKKQKNAATKPSIKSFSAPYAERNYFITNRVADAPVLPEAKRKNILSHGFAYVHMVSSDGIIAGTGAVVSPAAATPAAAILSPETFMALFLDTNPMDYANYKTRYPSVMGALVADLKQLKIDTLYHRDIGNFKFHHPMGRQYYRPELDVMRPYFSGKKPVLMVIDDIVEQRLARLLCRELGIEPTFVVHPDVWRRPGDLGPKTKALILPLGFKPPGKSKFARFGSAYKKHARTTIYPRQLASFIKSYPSVSLTPSESGDYETLFKNIRVLMEHGVTEAEAINALTANPARLLGLHGFAGAVKTGAIAGLTVTDKKIFDAEAKVLLTVADGNVFDYRPDTGKAQKTKKTKKENKKKDKKKKGRTKEVKTGDIPANITGVVASSGNSVLLRNADVYTFDKGLLRGCDILVTDGKIAEIGTGLNVPAEIREQKGFKTLDLSGKSVIPGVIDPHAHITLDGGYNELADYITPEIKVHYLINPDDPSIYYALSSGVTMAHTMYGSANPIGGENVVIKLKWGEMPEQMIEKRAVRTLKMALGENPRAPETLYPNTRMGVIAAIDTAFARALDYRKKWKRYEEKLAATPNGSLPDMLPPKKDLRLEALLETLDGKMVVRCHSYRADETLQLMRLSKKYGFKIAAFEHLQQAYRIADELKAMDIGVAMFPDFWNYKIEASEFTPYGLRFLNDKGVLISFKSDFVPAMRHLHYSAGLMRRYVGLNDIEALKTVTLNPARLLGMDAYTGSIEKGKDADLAVFDGNPLNPTSKCLLTFVEGRLYFDAARAPFPGKSPRTSKGDDK